MGLFRTFETRHGNGPMYREDKALVDVSSDHNVSNGSFAGNFRSGHLDVEKVRIAAKMCDCDSVAISWADKATSEFFHMLLRKFPNTKIVGYGPTALDRKEL